MFRHSYPGTRYLLRLDSEEFDVEVEGGVGRDDAPCSTAAVPQLRRHRDLTPLADLRNRASNAIEADIETDHEVCSVTASLQNPRRTEGTEYTSHHTLYMVQDVEHHQAPARQTRDSHNCEAVSFNQNVWVRKK